MGVSAAAPADAMVQFRGGGFMTDFSPECATGGFGGTIMVTSRYRPSGLSGNGPRSWLTVMHEPGAVNFNTQGRFQRSFAPVEAVALYSSVWPLISPQPQVQLLPGTTFSLNGDSTFVALIGEVNHFAQIEDCSFRLRLYMRRV
ncbi:MAG: hypothetical protein HLUCCA12_06145 [Rhodobacteraceae bacterium HLUCCA12]|nr:MAG: hypothetical protein HLUCCA12_06145 [Rhodobacteraceae bacterium HLUCCA12]